MMLAGVIALPAVPAADYTFAKIADNSPGTNLVPAPGGIAINASSTVAFRAFRTDARGNLTGVLVLTGSGGAPTIIAETASSGLSVYPTSINSSGTVLFTGVNPDFTYSLYTGSGGTPAKVPTLADDFILPNAAADINDDGLIAYYGGRIRVADKTSVRAVDPEVTNSALSMGQLNRGGSLVFVTRRDAVPCVAVDKGGTISIVASHSSSVNLTLTRFPAINDQGAVAFSGTVGTGIGQPAVFKVDKNQVTVIASGANQFSPVNINNNGTVAFGRLTGAVSDLGGIYVGPDPQADKVIAVGDAMFGSTVTSLDGIGRTPGRFLNDRGQIAFYYTLASGLTGVAVATPATPNLAAPLLPADSVVNAASLSATALAPGSIVSLFGERFASGLVVSSTAALPTSLSSVSVTFNGIAAPLYFVSPKQINAQVPMGITGTTVQVQVRASNGQSDIRTLTGGIYSPGIYTLTQSGSGQAIVTFADTSTLAAPRGTTPDSRPARAGDVLTIYANGLGPVTPAIESGVNSCGGICAPDFSNFTLRRVTTMPVVEIGGVRVPDENILFAGLAPQFVGLYQINLRLPAGIAARAAASVVLHQGSAASPASVTMAVE